MVTESVGEALHDVALFHDLGQAELDTLSHQVVRREFSRNELIFSQGDRGDGLYIVATGHVSITRQNPNGDELILAMYVPHEYFGELALFDDEPRSATATAIDECSLFFLSRAAFRGFLEAHPEALLTCLEVIVGQLRRTTDLADEIALLDVRSRLARRLLRLAQQGVVESERSAPGSAASYRITQQQLANMMGATRESVNKHLNAFVDEGMIRLERGHIHILDVKKLEACSIGLI
ncbi:MAG TPA: Crp/Fnr family transcriptional regulator [Chloroflexota bacterium]